MNNFKELINKANKKSIEDFYRFITNMYGIDNSLFESRIKRP